MSSFSPPPNERSHPRNKVLGSLGGGVCGLLAGLAYIEIANTSGFEGYSGFVVAFWIFGGVTIGMIFGLIVAYKLVRKLNY